MFTIKKIVDIIDGAELRNGGAAEIADSVCTDSRNAAPGALFLALRGERFDGHDYLDQALASGVTALCVAADFAATAELPSDVPVVVVPDTLKAYQALGRARRRSIPELRVVGITGSCGKTSVKELTAGILSFMHGSESVLSTESNTNNHIGVPMNLLRLSENHKFAVIEMGSNHPGEIEVLARTAEPDISLVTSVASAHLEFFRDLRGVAREKSAILEAVSDAAQAPTAVIPEESPGHDILRAAVGPMLYTFGTSESADLRFEYLGGDIAGTRMLLLDGERPLTREIKLPLRGRPQASNAAVAALAAILAEYPDLDAARRSGDRVPFAEIAADCDFAKLADALESCSLSGMRMRVEEIAGATWINDAYNANPDSVREALLWLAEFADPRKSRLALGDMLELGPESARRHSEIIELAVSLLPGASVFAIGPEMTNAVKNSPKLAASVRTYPDAESAKTAFSADIALGDIIFLKGSRGVALERLIPQR